MLTMILPLNPVRRVPRDVKHGALYGDVRRFAGVRAVAFGEVLGAYGVVFGRGDLDGVLGLEVFGGSVFRGVVCHFERFDLRMVGLEGWVRSCCRVGFGGKGVRWKIGCELDRRIDFERGGIIRDGGRRGMAG
jgi:hypothetical protein